MVTRCGSALVALNGAGKGKEFTLSPRQDIYRYTSDSEPYEEGDHACDLVDVSMLIQQNFADFTRGASTGQRFLAQYSVLDGHNFCAMSIETLLGRSQLRLSPQEAFNSLFSFTLLARSLWSL